MIESNYYILAHAKVKPRERSKRLAHLENTLAQLQQYHKVAPKFKRVRVFWLIVKYQDLLDKFKGA